MPPKTRNIRKRKGDNSSVAEAESPSKKKATKKEKEASLEGPQTRAAGRKNTRQVVQNAAKRAALTTRMGTPSRKPKSRQKKNVEEVPIPPRQTLLRPPRSNEENNQAPAAKEEIQSSPQSAFSSPAPPVASESPVSAKTELTWTYSAKLLAAYVVLFLLGFFVFRFSVRVWISLHNKLNYKWLMWAYIVYSTWRNVPH